MLQAEMILQYEGESINLLEYSSKLKIKVRCKVINKVHTNCLQK